jgi:hypothetical protein
MAGIIQGAKEKAPLIKEMELSKAITIFRDKAAQTDLNVSYPNLFNKKERNASSMIFSKPISMHPRIRQMKPLRTQGSMGRRKD